jgi:two-component system sensor histidine kinase KdpD
MALPPRQPLAGPAATAVRMDEERRGPAVRIDEEQRGPALRMDAERRGHLRVFLGMAAGVGKTFRMLLEGHAEQESGHDVVIGLLESHGRAETAALAEGLPRIPRRRVEYRGTMLEEMDLPAILRRAPELCLIDELAHTNVPAVEHHKRYEDIEDVLAAGIDVLSTVNVQHLESLNDQISELSGIRVRETIPDAVLGRADEIVMVDLTPEALLDRLRAGKVYPAERIDAALNNFFRIENLSALREVALRQVAEEIGHKRLITTEPVGSREETIAAEAPQAVGERLLALVEPYPGAQRLVRRAWRSAQRLGADLDLLWVRPPGPNLSDEQGRSLTGLKQLASVLGAHMLIEESDDVAATVATVARRRGTTYILLGRSRPARGVSRLRVPLPQRLMELLPGVDVRIVADRSRRSGKDQS